MGDPCLHASDFDGTVLAHLNYKFTMYSDDFIVYTISVPVKTVKLSGGLKLIVPPNESSSSPMDYVKEHIEDFKEKAYEAMPEAKKATNIPSVESEVSNV